MFGVFFQMAQWNFILHKKMHADPVHGQTNLFSVNKVVI